MHMRSIDAASKRVAGLIHSLTMYWPVCARAYSISNPDRRLVHNVSERHRRNSIKKGFADLKTCVPLSGREKHSKVDILNKGARARPKKRRRGACMAG